MVCSAYGWKHSYIVHDYRIHDDFLPYADWVEILEVIAEERADRAYREMELSAFLGFQVYNLSPYTGKQKLSWDKYRDGYIGGMPGTKKSGLGKKEAEIAKANKSFAKAFGEFINGQQKESI